MSRPAKILRRTQAAVAPLFTILIIVLPGAPAFAQSSPEYSSERSYSSEHSEDDRRLSFGTETDLSSDYAWRGIVLSNRPVVRPSVWISASGFTLIATRNLARANTLESADLGELSAGRHATDLTLTYGRDWKNLRIEPAIEAYLNGRLAGIHDPNTMEGQLKLSYPAGPLRLFTIHSFDVLAYKGSYFGEAGAGYERRVTNKASFALSLHSGWASSKFNEAYIGVNKPAINFVGAEGSFTRYVNRHLYFQPHFEFSEIVDRQLRQHLPRPTVINFGLAMGIEFSR